MSEEKIHTVFLEDRMPICLEPHTKFAPDFLVIDAMVGTGSYCSDCRETLARWQKNITAELEEERLLFKEGDDRDWFTRWYDRQPLEVLLFVGAFPLLAVATLCLIFALVFG